MPPFVVEGLTDAVFFHELVRSHYPNAIVGRSEEPEKRRIPDSIRATKPDGSELFLEFRNQNPYDPDQSGGRRRVHVAVRGLIRAGGVVQLAAAKDLNGDTPEAVVESLEGELTNTLGLAAETISENKLRAAVVTLGIVPMGLFGDADLNELGISRHSMEDYLIKLLLLDESLRPEVPRLRELLLSLLGTMRGSPYTIPFDSSKELFQLAKPIIKHGFSDTGVVESLFGNANPNILRSVMDPLIDRLERAVDL